MKKTLKQLAGLLLGLTVLVSTMPYTAHAATASVISSAYAGGGAGQSSANCNGSKCSGGGAGAFSKTNATTVTGGVSYTVTVGNGGLHHTNAAGDSGGDSWFSTTGIAPTSTTEGVLAKGGQGGTKFVSNNGVVEDGALGGDSAAGIGNTKFSGGKAGTIKNTGGGTGGGGGAGDAAVGGDASSVTNGLGTGGVGGTAGGGAGGDAGGGAGGGSGSTLGGGGGSDANSGGGGDGARGQLVIQALLGVITSATGGVHTSDATYDYWTFTASGTWTPTIPAAAGAQSATQMMMASDF